MCWKRHWFVQRQDAYTCDAIHNGRIFTNGSLRLQWLNGTCSWSVCDGPNSHQLAGWDFFVPWLAAKPQEPIAIAWVNRSQQLLQHAHPIGFGDNTNLLWWNNVNNQFCQLTTGVLYQRGIRRPFKCTGNHTYWGLTNNWDMQSKNGLQICEGIPCSSFSVKELDVIVHKNIFLV